MVLERCSGLKEFVHFTGIVLFGLLLIHSNRRFRTPLQLHSAVSASSAQVSFPPLGNTLQLNSGETRVRFSSYPYISHESWLEIAERSMDGRIQLLPNFTALPAAVSRSTRSTTYIISGPFDYNNPSLSDHEIIDLIEHSKRVCRIYAKNALYLSSRLKLLPIGPKWQYMSIAEYGEDKSFNLNALNAIGIRGVAPSRQEIIDRLGILIPNISLTNTNRNITIHGLRKRLSGSGVHTTHVNSLPYDDHLRLTRKHKFIASPPGNGRDCHRHWEALLVGTVPIIIRDASLEEAMSDLPVWWVESYAEVTEETYQHMTSNLPSLWEAAVVEKLYSPWWERAIKEPCT